MADRPTIEPRNPKGMRDFLPTELRVREAVLAQIKEVFSLYGYEPLETPAVELKETLSGKIGADEKLIYDVTYRGETELVLRYDLTLPLARVVAQYPDLPKPFKRYQTQAVYRADNPQKGRFRQFLQVDIDTVGSTSPLADAEVIECAIRAYQKLGVTNFKMLINSRPILQQAVADAGIPGELFMAVTVALDKIDKVGKAGVTAELSALGLTLDTITKLFNLLDDAKPDDNLKLIFDYLGMAGVDTGLFKFDPYLSRGFDYYTGVIFECDIDGYTGGSVGGGGRYDQLIGKFSGTETPAVGYSFGFDRLLDAMSELKLLPEAKPEVRALVTIFRDEPLLIRKAVEAAEKLRAAGVAAELFTGVAGLENQLKYADRKGIPFAVIIGPTEAEANQARLKNMATTEQQTVNLTDLASAIS